MKSQAHYFDIKLHLFSEFNPSLQTLMQTIIKAPQEVIGKMTLKLFEIHYKIQRYKNSKPWIKGTS